MSTFAWSPQPGPQSEAIGLDWCPELLYGGAAGGGKSDFLLGDYLQDVETYGEAWRGILFRRSFPELQELIGRSLEIYPASGGEWFAADKEWRWKNGAFLRMRYLERDADATRYQGHQYTWIGWDELTQWPSDYGYRYLRARLRSGAGVPTKRIRASANPGGAGHQWVKAYFIDPAPGGYVPVLNPATGMERMFVPSRLRDNLILMANDPGYEGRLRGLGSPELVRAWLEGDWTVVTGAYFPEFSMARHVIAPMEMPAHWTRFRAMDWGSAKPFSVGWYAVSDGELPQFPRGALIKYREYYGSTGEPNVGVRMVPEDVAREIKRRSEGETYAYSVCDPAMFDTQTGPCIAETMYRAGGITFRPADNKRSRLVGEDERPMIYFFSTCRDTIRTLPALQHDDTKPEDVDTDAEDHAGDETRYACMSRPWVRTAPEKLVSKTLQVGAPSTVTMNDLWSARKPRGGRV
jgi:hypothetical protein